MELQLDATITVFIDLLDQLNMFRANICPSSGAQEQLECLQCVWSSGSLRQTVFTELFILIEDIPLCFTSHNKTNSLLHKKQNNIVVEEVYEIFIF
jgi:hypothetical protein